MAEISWEIIDTQCDINDVITVTVQELTDGQPSAVPRLYAASIHKDQIDKQIKLAGQIKTKVLTDRARRAKIAAFAGSLNVDNLESYINQ